MPTENTNDEQVVDTPKDVDTSQSEKNTQQDEQPQLTLEEAISKIQKLEGINKEVIGDRDKVKSRLRELEEIEAQKEEQLLTEQGQYKELLEKEKERAQKLENTIRDREIDSIIEKQLRDEGLSDEALGTAKALINKSDISYDLDAGVDTKAINDSISALKENHKVLFSAKPKTPDVKRASDRSQPKTYIEELKALREKGGTRKELEALRAKYNR